MFRIVWGTTLVGQEPRHHKRVKVVAERAGIGDDMSPSRGGVDACRQHTWREMRTQPVEAPEWVPPGNDDVSETYFRASRVAPARIRAFSRGLQNRTELVVACRVAAPVGDATSYCKPRATPYR